MRLRQRAWMPLLLVGAACAGDGSASDTGGPTEPPPGPDFDVLHATHYVDIAPGFTQSVCRGTRDEIDRYVETVATFLELDVEDRIRWFWFNEGAQGARTDEDVCDWCSNCRGCAHGSRAVIYANWIDVFHEAVHALVIPAWGRSDKLFEEGVANGLDRWLHAGINPHQVHDDELPSELAGGTQHGGGHFSRWLIDRFGPAKFRELFEPRLDQHSTKEDVFAAVQEVYGIPFLDLEAEYLATAPYLYPALGLCDGLLEVPWTEEDFDVQLTTDCEDAHVFGPDDDGALWVSFTTVVPEGIDDDKLVRYSGTNIDIGHMLPCYDAPVQDETDIRHTAIVSPHIGMPGFAAGRYRVDVKLEQPGAPLQLTIDVR